MTNIHPFTSSPVNATQNQSDLEKRDLAVSTFARYASCKSRTSRILRKIVRTVAHKVFNARTMERSLRVVFKEFADASPVAVATSSIIAGLVSRRPLFGATSREPAFTNLSHVFNCIYGRGSSY